MQPPHNLLDQLSLCVDGVLNEISAGVLHSINKANPAGLTDFINKLQKLQIQIQAELLDKLIHAVDTQFKIPDNILQIVQEFLLNTDQTYLFETLETCIQTSKFQQSVLYMMDRLQLFAGNLIEDQFLRLILSFIWQGLHQPEESLAETLTKLKAILGLPNSSPIIQLISWIADQCQLSKMVIAGKNRSMDGMEVFFLLKNVFLANENALNKKFIQQIQSAILISVIYKSSPQAFYDLIAWHYHHLDFSLLGPFQAQQKNSILIDQFLTKERFKPYFATQRYQNVQANQHAFLASLANHLHDALQSAEPSILNLVSFVAECVVTFRQKNNQSFFQWFENNAYFKQTEQNILSALLQTLHQFAVKQKTLHAGRIRANALQLVALGCSHRSAATSTTGAFIPLVNSHIAEIDVMNVVELIDFVNSQTPAQQLKLLQEILLNYVLYAQNLPAAPTTKSAIISKSTLKPTVAKLFRANPLNPNRLFTLKPSTNIQVTACEEGRKSSLN